MSAAMVVFLARLAKQLQQTGIPLYYDLPSGGVPEPFFVIGAHDEDDSGTPKVGCLVLATVIQVDLFYPIGNRSAVEQVIHDTRLALGRYQRVTSRLTIDRSLQRAVYHVVFQVEEQVIEGGVQ